ncbi:gag/pol/env polyprotein, putative [Perkinsus marinus ATCC 50983]|uniref:RNA-directed DNA polymerase n=1 Tax=Perkinsus marinus (strain ATCC 50983 / TXsc) TaxID=423536 RepID=C5LVW7_PERM5|nr:gag/pol/env polyprotein, putative [Perkinsus marinus ATCC 50983]EEQ99118.1 gag/pol/env polyprotein, putative [Perkinsus marinus ATCC 50983]|eukprot:XP_002766401.1 gag/pol/env polyprotein, putative [Perkinsus marinus ATCC 50983]
MATPTCVHSTPGRKPGTVETNGTHRGASHHYDGGLFDNKVMPYRGLLSDVGLLPMMTVEPRTCAMVQTRRGATERIDAPGGEDGSPISPSQVSGNTSRHDMSPRGSGQSRTGVVAVVAEEAQSERIGQKAIDDFLSGLDGEVRAQIYGSLEEPRYLPKPEQAVSMGTLSLLEKTMGQSYNCWLTLANGLKGHAGERYGLDPRGFVKSWGLFAWAHSPASKWTGVVTKEEPAEHGEAQRMGCAWFDEVQRCLTLCRASLGAQLIVWVALLPSQLTLSLRQTLLDICKNEDANRDTALVWTKWVHWDGKSEKENVKVDYLAWTELLGGWLKQVLDVANEHFRPRPSLAKAMALWSGLKIAADEALEVFLQKEDELWLILHEHMQGGSIRWEHRRERIISAMMTCPSWRPAIQNSLEILEAASDYRSFRTRLLLERKLGLKKKILPRFEARRTTPASTAEQTFAGPEWATDQDPHLPEYHRVSELRRQGQGSVATATTPADDTRTDGEAQKVKERDRKEKRCYKCHKPGHRARECGKRGQRKKQTDDVRNDGTRLRPSSSATADDMIVEDPVLEEPSADSRIDNYGESVVEAKCDDPQCASHGNAATTGSLSSSALTVASTSERRTAVANGVPILIKSDLKGTDSYAYVFDFSDPSHNGELMIIRVYDHAGRPFNALLDSGSEVTLVSADKATSPCTRRNCVREGITIVGVGDKHTLTTPVDLFLAMSKNGPLVPVEASLSPGLPREVDAILGIGALRLLRWSVDPLKGVVTLRTPLHVCTKAMSKVNTVAPKQTLFAARIQVKQEDPPIKHRGFPIAPNRLRAARDTIDQLVDEGKIELLTPSQVLEPSQWISPVFLKRKATAPGEDVKYRILNDLRQVNTRLMIHSYPGDGNVPLLVNQIPRWCKAYACLDISSAFHCVPLEKPSRRYLGGVLAGVYFRWCVLPQGLGLSPYWWAKFIRDVLSRSGICDKFAGRVIILIYVDDVLLGGRNIEDVREAYHELCKILLAADIPLNQAKSKLPTTTLDFVGLHLDATGWGPTLSAMEALEALPAPRSREELMSVLGTVNYLRHAYDPADLQINLAPLQLLLKKHARYQWDTAQESAFHWLKGALKNTVFSFQPLDEPLYEHEGWVVQSDASDLGISFVLWRCKLDPELKSGEISPSYLSQHGVIVAASGRRLRGAEVNYATFDAEGLAVVEALKKLRPYLLLPTPSGGYPRTVVQTDSNASKCRFTAVPTFEDFTQNPVRFKRWCRWAEAIGDLFLNPGLELVHIRGDSNHLADLFSRVLQDCPSDDIGVYAVESGVMGADDELEDSCSCCSEFGSPNEDEVRHMVMAVEAPDEVPLELQQLHRANRIEADGSALIYTDAKGRRRTYVPEERRSSALDSAHGPAHASAERTERDLIESSLWWPRMGKDVGLFVRSCLECARHSASKAALRPRHELQPTLSSVSEENERFSSVAIDHCGPLPGTSGSLVLIMVDMVTGWLEATIVPNKSARCTVDALYQAWVCRWGWFRRLHSDNDMGYRSSIVEELCARYKVRHTFSPPRWPRANGCAEAVVKELKVVISKTSKGLQKQGYDVATLVAATVFLHNSSRVVGLPCSPFEAVTGAKPRTMSSFASTTCSSYGPVDVAKLEATVNLMKSAKESLRQKWRDYANRRASHHHGLSYGNDVTMGVLVFVVSDHSLKGRQVSGPFRVSRVEGARAWINGESSPVSVGQCIVYQPDYRFVDEASVEAASALEVSFESLNIGDAVFYCVIDSAPVGPPTMALDFGTVARLPAGDRVLVEPYYSSNGLRWQRRAPRDRYLKEVTRPSVKITRKSTRAVVDSDGHLMPDVIEMIRERGWPIPDEDVK